MSDDPASSLRAAALLSLKSKQSQRRGPQAIPPTISQRAETVSLTYDEPERPPHPAASSSSTGVNAKMDVDEAVDADLEDGEISDSADVTSAPPLVETKLPTVMSPVLAQAPIPSKTSVGPPISLTIAVLSYQIAAESNDPTSSIASCSPQCAFPSLYSLAFLRPCDF